MNGGVSSKPPVIDRLNAQMGAWEQKYAAAVAGVTSSLPANLRLHPTLRLALGCMALLVSIPAYIVWFGPHGGFAAGRAALALTIVGIALLLGASLLKQPKPLIETRLPGEPFVIFANRASNLATAQLIAVLATIAWAVRAEIDEAWWSAIVVVGFTPVLLRSKAHIASIVMGTAGGFYLVYAFAVSDIGYTIASNAYARTLPEYIVPIGLIAWTMIVIALFPQLQILQLGNVGIGRFKGDTQIRLFGSTTPVAITSAVLLVSTYAAIVQLIYLPRWIGVALSS